MNRKIIFISHPDVSISATIPVTQWSLSETGIQRMEKMLMQPWVSSISVIYSSGEQKSIDGANILGDHLGLAHTQVEALGENDRSSTGFLEPAEFESTADAFFSSPDTSIRGWETAIAAQQRIVSSVKNIDVEDATDGTIAIVSHGAVGTLLYCSLAQKTISRRWDQPGSGGGNYLTIDKSNNPSCTWWQPID